MGKSAKIRRSIRYVYNSILERISFLINYFFYINILERPDEPYDSRSLYDRLQEQKQKKDLEYEEAHKLSIQHYLLLKSTNKPLSY